MKIITTIALFLFSIVGFSQNLNTIESLFKASTEQQIKTASDEMVSATNQNYVFYKIADSSLRDEKRKVVLYTLASATDNDNTKLSETEKQNLVKVVWQVTPSGFSFKEVFAPGEVLKPYWNRTFSASENNYRLNPETQYKLVQNENSYSIEKWY